MCINIGAHQDATTGAITIGSSAEVTINSSAGHIYVGIGALSFSSIDGEIAIDGDITIGNGAQVTITGNSLYVGIGTYTTGSGSTIGAITICDDAEVKITSCNGGMDVGIGVYAVYGATAGDITTGNRAEVTIAGCPGIGIGGSITGQPAQSK